MNKLPVVRCELARTFSNPMYALYLSSLLSDLKANGDELVRNSRGKTNQGKLYGLIISNSRKKVIRLSI